MATVSDLTAAKNNALSTIPNVKQQAPDQFQNANNTALANTSYNNLKLNDISSGYKDQVNNSLNNANSNTSYYQGQISDALNNYNNAYTVNPIDSTTFKNNMTNSINSLYDKEKENVPLYYQPGIDQAKQQYVGLKNQASVTDQQSLNKLKESMAQQGLFNSGDNITAQTEINNQYANDLSGYNKQEQNYYDTTNNQIAQQKASYDAQAAQALIDLGYKADTRDFSLADLYDTRNQNKFNNSMTANNSMYGMSQDQYNNTIKAIAQQYGMDEDQVQNLLNYTQYNSSENQRQYSNNSATNQSNYDMYNNTIHNDQSQQQITNQVNQWQQQFDYQKQQDAIANALAQAKFDASRSSGGSGGGRSSGRSSSSGSSSSKASQADQILSTYKAGINSGKTPEVAEWLRDNGDSIKAVSPTLYENIMMDMHNQVQ